MVTAGIRHPEELSLARKMDVEALKRNQGVSATRRTQIPGMTSSPNGHTPLNNSYDSGTLGSPYRNSSTPQVLFLLAGVSTIVSMSAGSFNISTFTGEAFLDGPGHFQSTNSRLTQTSILPGTML